MDVLLLVRQISRKSAVGKTNLKTTAKNKKQGRIQAACTTTIIEWRAHRTAHSTTCRKEDSRKPCIFQCLLSDAAYAALSLAMHVNLCKR